MLPTVEEALKELETAGQMNPGPWVKHSMNTGLAARNIAENVPGMDPNPRGWGLQEYFDICAPNFFGREDWSRAIEAITKCAEDASEPEKEFYSEIITRMRGFLDVNDMYCIDGNL